MEKVIKAAVDRGASDLHIKAGDVFRARIDGKLVPLTKQRLTPEQTRAIALRLMTNAEDKARIDQIRDYDCSWGMPGVGRFRVNVLRQRSSFMIVMRAIPFDVPTIELLGLPAGLATIVETERGLLLVTGVSGSGKTSTIAALVGHVNRVLQRHILTLEDPIEYLHRDLKSSVTQREIGVDTESVRAGLRAALRQDPDIVVIGDLRDAEAVDTAIKAAETSRLMIGTMLTPDAVSTIARLIALFPASDQEIVRARLAEALHAIISQRLLPRADGKGRVAAVEIMIATPEVRALLRRRDGLDDLRHMMAASRDVGMVTLDQHLLELTRSGTLSSEVALAAAANPAELEAALGATASKATAT